MSCFIERGMEADPRDILIAELREQNAEFRRRCSELEEKVEALTKQVEELRLTAHRQAAPFRRPPGKRGGKGKGPGRPGGHPGSFRVRPDQVDQELEAKLDGCPVCGGVVTDLEVCEQFIEDLPEIRPQVTRLRTYSGWCGRCGQRVRSQHPSQVSTATGAAGTHLGQRALALAGLLNKSMGLPMRKTCRALKTLGGLLITPGGLSQALDRVADRCEPVMKRLQRELRIQPVVYADETSWWVNGSQAWLWGFTSPDLTVYQVRQSRGRDVVLDTLGGDFKGVLVSDCLASYETLPFRMQKCYAHHLKAIGAALEAEPNSEYLQHLRSLLHTAMMLANIRSGVPPPQWEWARRGLDHRADTLLNNPRTDPIEEGVANRLRKRRQWLFTFLDHPEVEPTNNRAERALRPAVITRKLSCGNKTERGVRTWEILASLAATYGEQFIEIVRPRLDLSSR